MTPESALMRQITDYWTRINLTIPMVPPSVNNYVRHTKAGYHYKTGAANSFLNVLSAVVQNAGFPKMNPEKYYKVYIDVYLGKGERRDWDNVPKCVCDGLVACSVIESDARIKCGTVRILRDSTGYGYTDVTIEEM